MRRIGWSFFILAAFSVLKLEAGPVDMMEIDREIRGLDRKAKDFIDLDRATKLKKSANADRLKFINERRNHEEKKELYRRRYVESRVESTGDRGYGKYLNEIAAEERRQKSHLDQFLKEKRRLQKAIERYREKVPGFKEVDLNEQGLSANE